MNIQTIIALLIISGALTLALIFISKNGLCGKNCNSCPYNKNCDDKII